MWVLTCIGPPRTETRARAIFPVVGTGRTASILERYRYALEARTALAAKNTITVSRSQEERNRGPTTYREQNHYSLSIVTSYIPHSWSELLRYDLTLFLNKKFTIFSDREAPCWERTQNPGPAISPGRSACSSAKTKTFPGRNRLPSRLSLPEPRERSGPPSLIMTREAQTVGGGVAERTVHLLV